MFADFIRLRAGIAARRAGHSAAGVVFALAAIGFLTAAAWMVLAEMRDALFAATVLGAAYLGISLVFFALAHRAARAARIARQTARATSVPPSVAGGLLPPIFEAFLVGLSAGAARAAARRL